MTSTSKPGFWAQRTLALLDDLKGHLPSATWENARDLIALVTAQADAYDHISATLNPAQRAQAKMVIDKTRLGFEGETL